MRAAESPGIPLLVIIAEIEAVKGHTPYLKG